MPASITDQKLQAAALAGDTQKVAALVSQASPNHGIRRSLQLAAAEGNEAVIDIILAAIPPTNRMLTSSAREDVLLAAVEHGHMDILSNSLCNDYELELTRFGISHALTLAVQCNRLPVISLLLDKMAQRPSLCAPDVMTEPLATAASNGFIDIAARLLEAYPQALKSSADPLYSAVRAGHTDMVQFFLSHCEPGSDRAHALGIAASIGRADMVALLLPRSGPSKEVFPNENPILIAARNGHHQVVELLLNRCTAHDRMVALVSAAIKGHIDVVEALLPHVEDLPSICPPKEPIRFTPQAQQRIQSWIDQKALSSPTDNAAFAPRPKV